MRFQGIVRLGFVLCAFGAPVVAPSRAHADGGDLVLARTLFNDARKLAIAGKYTEACPKFEESARLNPGIGTNFNLADCWEHIGRTASAWAKYLDVAASAEVEHQADRAKVARERAGALEGGLSRLTIEVNPGNTAVEIKNDGLVVGRPSWGTAIPVDPGSHVIEASAAGRKPWKSVVEVAPHGAKANVVVPLLEAETPASATTNVGSSVASTNSTFAEPATDRSGETSGHSIGKTAGFVVMGAGVAGLVVGTIFVLKEKSKNDAARDICTNLPAGAPCPEPDTENYKSLTDDARSARTTSIVGFAVGGVGVVVGSVLILTSHSSSAAAAATTPPKLTFTPQLASNAWGLNLAGSW